MINFATEFHDLQSLHGREYALVQSKFEDDLAIFLADHVEMDYRDASAIARSVFARMSNRRLHYHTPYHVLQMLAFAEQNSIRLETWERLAVWFHDVIYWPGWGFGPSESASAAFMMATLPPLVSDSVVHPYSNMLARARYAILSTAKHLEPGVDPAYFRLLDLDVNVFLAKEEMARQVDSCLQQELCPDDPDRWNRGRADFLEKMLAKGYVFRHPDFEKFNAEALANMQETIDEYRRKANV